MPRLNINDAVYELDVDENMPLLWALRDELGLVGTKYGCGKGICGACSVLMGGVSVRSCITRVGDVSDRVATIESMGQDPSLHPVQEAWIENQVAQCGYCQPGQILSAIALLAENPDPTDDEIHRALAHHLCRCGSYSRVRDAVKSAAEQLRTEKASS